MTNNKVYFDVSLIFVNLGHTRSYLVSKPRINVTE